MKKIILIGLILLSGVFIALSIKNFRTPQTKGNSPEILYSTVIEKNNLDILRTVFKNEFTRQDRLISAVFLMYAKNCNACFNEVNGYIDLLEEKDNKLESSILSYGVFHHENMNIAQRFKLTTDLRFDNILATNGKKLFEKGLLTFKGKEAYNQLLLINADGNLFCRILLPAGITTTRKKKNEVINLMLNQNT